MYQRASSKEASGRSGQAPGRLTALPDEETLRREILASHHALEDHAAATKGLP